jgi:hypothetical protein
MRPSQDVGDLTNQKFGKLTVIGLDSSQNNGLFWICKCECGNIVSKRGQKLVSGNNKSCGCLRKEGKHIITHGLSGTRIYKLWRGIKTRCYNKNHKDYNNYGGRGIKLCEEWDSDPVIFVEYVSKLENYDKKGYSLDRIDNSGNYEPGNVRWVTQKTQGINSLYNRNNYKTLHSYNIYDLWNKFYFCLI